MSKRKRWKWNAMLVLAVAFAVFVAFFAVWWLRPYPTVFTSEDYKQVSPPEPQRVGTVVSWTKPKVCTPPGLTDVTTYARSYLGNGGDTLDYELFRRTFNRAAEVCNEPNGTTIIIPSWVPNGTYEIVIIACTRNPTPFPECVETVGPVFTVVGQPDRLNGQSKP